jgi:hypothetical protein
MTRHRLVLRTFASAVVAAALAASAAAAMPARDTGRQGERHEIRPVPALVDAAAHAATMRGIGALAERSCE